MTSYVNNFPDRDNAFSIPLPSNGDVQNNSFAFLLSDFGFETTSMGGKCCQTDVAELMRVTRRNLESERKHLLFIAAGGDNFYWRGLKGAGEGGETQWKRWESVYEDLHDVPWFAVMGNHDLGDYDLYATCPEKNPRVSIGTQAYASNQLDMDKGGYRPSNGHAQNYHMPDFNYRLTLDALNFELYALDQNYVYEHGIGGGNNDKIGRACGDTLKQRLGSVSESGESLLVQSAMAGAKDPSQTRNVLVVQHYPEQCAHLKRMFMQNIPEGEVVDFRCSAGHKHDTECNLGLEEDCEFSVNGGGGGCCSHDVSTQAGFGLLTFKPSGGMRIELIHLAHMCNFDCEANWWFAVWIVLTVLVGVAICVLCVNIHRVKNHVDTKETTPLIDKVAFRANVTRENTDIRLLHDTTLQTRGSSYPNLSACKILTHLVK